MGHGYIDVLHDHLSILLRCMTKYLDKISFIIFKLGFLYSPASDPFIVSKITVKDQYGFEGFEIIVFHEPQRHNMETYIVIGG